MKSRLTLVMWAALPLRAFGSFGPRYGGELRVGLRTLPASLEPGAPGEPEQTLALGLVQETLVSTSSEGTLIPSLAKSWSGGEKEWVLTLSPGLSFHDSSSITAENAVR